MNKVLLVGRLTRDPEMRVLSSGKAVTTFAVAIDQPGATTEYTPVIVWDRLAEIVGRHLGKSQRVEVEGALQTRTWDDAAGMRHWKTEVVANHVEILTGRNAGAVAGALAEDAQYQREVAAVAQATKTPATTA